MLPFSTLEENLQVIIFVLIITSSSNLPFKDREKETTFFYLNAS
jgi:hypothetical protein